MANFVWKCGTCKREASARFEPSFPTIPYSAENGQFAPFVALDCRNLEFVEFDPKVCRSLHTVSSQADVCLNFLAVGYMGVRWC